MTNDRLHFDKFLERAVALTSSECNDSNLITDLVSELVRIVLHRARSIETSRELRPRVTLGQLLSSANYQTFSVALTDRAHRTKNADAVVSELAELIERANPAPGLPTLDRLQLLAAEHVAPHLPELALHALLLRVDREASPFLVHADEPQLTRELSLIKARAGSVNLNYLGEEVVGQADAEHRRLTYASLAQREDIDALSLKLSGIDAHLDPIAVEENVERLFASVAGIVRSARDNVHAPILYFDMEAYRDLEMSEALLLRLLETQPESQNWPARIQFGLAVQAYLPEALGLIERLAESSKRRVERGYLPLRIRLVKGANLHTERVEASLRGLKCPIFDSKLETDAHYKRCLRRLAEHAHLGALHVGVASHNLFDLGYALVLRARTQTPDQIQIEMLEGMAGATGRALAQLAGSLLIYAPAVHEEHLSSAVSYLVRRLDENTAAGHFLRDAAQMEPDDAAFERQRLAFSASFEESWITPPETLRKQDRSKRTRTGRFYRRNEFNNAPDTDWTRHANRVWLRDALHQAELDVAVHPLLDESISDTNFIETLGFDPSRPQADGYPVLLARKKHIELAISAAVEAQLTWSRVLLSERIALLREVAQRLEDGRGELIAALVLDAGKRPFEADIEVSEAVDFARYYAFVAEQQCLSGEARGVTVVTPPWNFPLAIALGGVFAALVTGNVVLLKPAPETPWVAQLAVKFCHEAGVSRSVLQLIPCRDEDASPLISDPRIATVILTGATSTAQLFLKMRPGLHLLAETGGKNAAYVSALSDRELAISHIVQSAFGHSGQKCSALSLLILEREVFENEEFKHQLVDAITTLSVGSAWQAGSMITPLIHPPAGALATVLAEGERYGTWLVRPQLSTDNPRLLSPGILWGIAPYSFPHQTELFGPILSVLCAEDFNDGMRLLNSTSYGLTAGLFSLRETEQERFIQMADAGNLYINRPITGAVVGRQPFGGRKMSGFGPGAQAGGENYLRQLVLPPRLLANESWSRILTSYQYAAKYLVDGVHPGTPVLGENNFSRHQPSRTLVIIGEEVDELCLAATLLALSLTHNQLPLFVLSDAQGARSGNLVGGVQSMSSIKPRVAPIHGTTNELMSYAEEHQIARLRTLGRLPLSLLQQAAQQPLTLISDPVSGDGMYELPHYLLSQSVSHTFHRHGNLKLGQLSRMSEALHSKKSPTR